MAFQTIFKRYEIKYLISREQKATLMKKIALFTERDKYGFSTVRNLYYDTDTYRLIRRSLEKPVYKEKLRMRCYCDATPETQVFTELKKKYKRVVYKRRLFLPQKEAEGWLGGSFSLPESSQISREIDYFLEFYSPLSPKVFLSYDREAFFGAEDSSFRVTFDENVLCRTEDLTLCSPPYGKAILPEGAVLMEIKCQGGSLFGWFAFSQRERSEKPRFPNTAWRIRL